VDVVFHLVGSERQGNQADLMGVDIEGTRTIANVAADTGIKRFFYMSHLGADRASAFPLLKTKAIAESYILKSQVPYTIFRSAVVYGAGDQFTTEFARLLRIAPGVLLIPGKGDTLLQPLWIEDLVTCLILAIEDANTTNQIYQIGGPEYLPFRDILKTLMQVTGIRRPTIAISPGYLRILSILLENTYKRFPISSFWQDYLAADRTCDLDTLPRLFGLMPERFNRQLDYLSPGKQALASLSERSKGKYR
jgi:NADH dehydrogenase